MAEPELSIELVLDEADYPASQPITLTAKLTIRNWSADPVVLAFPSSQQYDLEIHNDQGDVVYSWSKGQAFSQSTTELQIQYEKEFSITAPAGSLPPGKYVAQAWLTVEGPPRAYSASARFHVMSM